MSAVFQVLRVRYQLWIGNFILVLGLIGCGGGGLKVETAVVNLPATRGHSATATVVTTQPSSPLPLPSTAEPTQTRTRLPTQTATIRPPTPTPTRTPTFAAYGITHPIGFSAEGRPIVAHRFGFGRHVIVIVGGIHGGYEWNTIDLSYQLIDHFSENVEQIPSAVTLYIIPSANPDGQARVTGSEGRIGESDIAPDTIPGRFNGNGVDLNRNWNCDWASAGSWGEREVDGGERPFSEPESRALSRFFLVQRAAAVIFLHSAAEGVYPGGCPEPLPRTLALAEAYSESSGYPLYESFASYPITGDASDWLALQHIPSFSVELKTHDQAEFEPNLLGVQALLLAFE